ncbi:virulence-associated E family protein [Clostridioides mangenotii]|uniref:virulence-associated E family protein n=1 Tax=Metaclostridioides mangenotii TaxID=1540 RepID=UPI002F410840
MNSVNEEIQIKVIHDKDIQLATGKSKTETHWKNKTIKWSTLVEKLSKTTRTQETCAEYKKMSKTERDKLKDVGGYVGGSLKNGRRKAENIQNRTLITLDIDYAKGDIWCGIEILSSYTCVMYSTHSHTPDNQRLRLVIPLSRPVLPDEYQAIARMIAEDIGIDMFDDTTYQPHRLMYWPSTPSDAEYIFKFKDDDFLDPDEVLSRYLDWTDVSYWPQSSRETKIIDNQIKKQEDPLEKKGVIGAFCRTYTISEVMDIFLDDVYSSGLLDDTRYTFIDGSTSGGVVTYDDKFSFSHHGTDPTSGLLCNAFDLVRIHKFGHLDEDAKPDTPVNRLPSFTKMSEFATEDKKVRTTLGKERLDIALEDFGDVEIDDTEWLERLTVNSKGEYFKTTDNILIILENDPHLKGKIAYNQFSNRAIVLGQLPWRNDSDKVDWVDADDAGLRHHIETIYNIASPAKVNDALVMSFEKHAFHPIKEYLNTLAWDGVERLDTLFIDYLGAEDSEYTRVAARKVITAAVARVFVPGIKFDNMPVLSGPQGIGKSTLIKKLGQEWYSDSLTTVQGKEAYEQLQGVWVLEMGEMMATKKADIESIKHFLSKTEDIYRVAYGKHTNRFPRQCIFIGTTNDREFLRDKTGNRRFWPIDVGINRVTKSPFTITQETIDQIWAEALTRFKNKEPLYLTGEQEQEAKKQQESHSEESAKTGLIREYLDKKVPTNWYDLGVRERRDYIHDNEDFGESGGIERETFIRDKTCVMEIWVELFNGDPKQLSPIQSREINDILTGLSEWKKAKGNLRFGATYGTQRAYTRKIDEPFKV